MAARMTTPSYYLTLAVLTIPVKSYTAARDAKFQFVNLHRPCAEEGHDARLSAPKRCTVCRNDVASDAIVKGYAIDRGRYVFITDEELNELHPEKSKTMAIDRFVPMADVDPVFLGRSNHLGPADGAAAKGFALLRAAMLQADRAAVVCYVAHGHDRLGLLRPTDDGLMLHEMFYPAEVATFAEQNRVTTGPVELRKEELDLARQLIAAVDGAFDLAGYTDGYDARVQQLVEARRSGTPVPKAEPKAATAPVTDLMAALRQSLAARGTAPAVAKPSKAARTSPRRKAA